MFFEYTSACARTQKPYKDACLYMTTLQTQQVDGAQSAGQAVATATPAITQTPSQPPQQAPEAPQRTFGMTDAEYARQAKDESIRRKGKIKALKSEVAKITTDLAQTSKERDALKAAAATYEERLNAINTKRSEDLLVSELRGAGLSEAAARLLIPSLRAHVTVDPKTYDIALNKEEITKAVAEIKPPQPQTPPQNGAQRLHQLNAAARTEPVQTRPLSALEQLKANARAVQGK
jgi:hypothetical protein